MRATSLLTIFEIHHVRREVPTYWPGILEERATIDNAEDHNGSAIASSPPAEDEPEATQPPPPATPQAADHQSSPAQRESEPPSSPAARPSTPHPSPTPTPHDVDRDRATARSVSASPAKVNGPSDVGNAGTKDEDEEMEERVPKKRKTRRGSEEECILHDPVSARLSRSRRGADI